MHSVNYGSERVKVLNPPNVLFTLVHDKNKTRRCSSFDFSLLLNFVATKSKILKYQKKRGIQTAQILCIKKVNLRGVYELIQVSIYVNKSVKDTVFFVSSPRAVKQDGDFLTFIQTYRKRRKKPHDLETFHFGLCPGPSKGVSRAGRDLVLTSVLLKFDRGSFKKQPTTKAA